MPTESIAAPPQCHDPEAPDPLKALQPFPYRRLFAPLGFHVEIQSNSLQILEAAAESWPLPPSYDSIQIPLRVRLGVALTSSPADACPPAPVIRAHAHLLSIIAGPENFATCDLRSGEAFGWVTQATLHHRTYLRYLFLEAIVLCLLSGSRVTPIHGACISRNGFGILLCGISGAGKSTVAYACARAGFTFTSDDASYLLWDQPLPTVRGNSHHIRFRPSAQTLFPELDGRALTPRAEGKPSIEVPTTELPILTTAPESPLHAVVFLDRHTSPGTTLNPLTPAAVAPYLESSLFPLEGIRDRQAAALRQLYALHLHQLSYCDLPRAIACLESLTETAGSR